MKEARAAKEEVKAPKPLRVVTKKVSQDSIDESEICLSPSWSDHGQKERKEERKRREKESKELRRKLEDENRKPPKRLNKKPPPAAMDTQKTSADLRKPRRNSFSSLLGSRSREPSQERPKDERRLSGASFTSFLPGRRSQSQQRQAPTDDEGPQSPESWKPIVSPTAPKLPSFRWKKPGETKPGSWGDNNASDELVAFPYEQQSPNEKQPIEREVKVEEPDSDPIAHLAQQRTIRPMIRSSTEPNFKMADAKPKVQPATASAAKDKPALKREKSDSANAKPLSTNKQNGVSPSPVANQQQRSDKVAAELIAMLSDNKRNPYQHVNSTPKGYTNQVNDGSSYVHKQRMFEQQRSIAGFEEQQALQMYNEQAALAAMQQDIRDVQAAKKEVTKTPSRETSPIGSRARSSSREAKERRESVSPARRTPSQQPRQSALFPLKQVSSAPEDSDDEQEKKIKRAKEEISQKMQSLQAGKSDKMFGFRRRHKEAPVAVKVNGHDGQPTAKTNDGTQDQDAPKLSRRDRMSAHIPFRHRRNSSGGAVALNVKSGNNKEDEEPRNRSSASLVNGVHQSPQPSPATTRPGPRVTGQKNSTDSDESWHSTSEAPESKSSKELKQPGRGSHDAAALAAVYSEGIKTPSSEESLNDEPENEKRKSPELVVKGVSNEGVIRKASITRPRSIPNLKSNPSDTAVNLDFLPQLKHKPLPKSPRRPSNQNSAESSPTRIKLPTAATVPDTSYKSPLSNTPDLALLPRSPLRPPSAFPLPIANRSATSIATPGLPNKSGVGESVDAKPIAKLFVICCKCKFWHDLPSKLYEAMALPKELHRKDDDASDKSGADAKAPQERKGGKATEKGKAGKQVNGNGKGVTGLKGAEDKVKTARLETAVQCPWCEHSMTTYCCQGWTTVVYMHERHH